MNHANKLTPSQLCIILAVGMLLIFTVAGAGFWFFRSNLTSFAERVSAATSAANVSSNDVSNLQKLETELKDNAVAVNRAKNIVADSKSYQYQNQIISDLNTYAKASGLTVSEYSFMSDAAGGTDAAAATASDPAAAAATQAPAGLKSTKVTITLKAPVTYQAVMRFIHSLELNLTKMQLTGISLGSAGSNGVNSEVSVNPLTIEVYTK